MSLPKVWTQETVRLIYDRPDGLHPCDTETSPAQKNRKESGFYINGTLEIPCKAFRPASKGGFIAEVPKILNENGEFLIEIHLGSLGIQFFDRLDTGTKYGAEYNYAGQIYDVWYAQDQQSVCVSIYCPDCAPKNCPNYPNLAKRNYYRIGGYDTENGGSVIPVDLKGRKTLPYYLSTGWGNVNVNLDIRNFCGNIPDLFWVTLSQHNWGTSPAIDVDLTNSCLRNIPETIQKLKIKTYLGLRGSYISSLPSWITERDCWPGGLYLDLRGTPIAVSSPLLTKGYLSLPECIRKNMEFIGNE